MIMFRKSTNVSLAMKRMPLGILILFLGVFARNTARAPPKT